jgi:hypothetical protein
VSKEIIPLCHTYFSIQNFPHQTVIYVSVFSRVEKVMLCGTLRFQGFDTVAYCLNKFETSRELYALNISPSSAALYEKQAYSILFHVTYGKYNVQTGRYSISFSIRTIRGTSVNKSTDCGMKERVSYFGRGVGGGGRSFPRKHNRSCSLDIPAVYSMAGRCCFPWGKAVAEFG